MHSLSRKNVTAIDHMLRWLSEVLGAVSSTQWQYNAASYRHSSICSKLQLHLCTKIVIKMIIKQIIHLPSHFCQFDYAQAKNFLNGDTIV